MSTSRTNEVLNALRTHIVRATFKPGEKLHIEGICDLLGASLGAVREALSRLSAEGLVVVRPQRGFIVAPISLKDLRDLTDVRVDVESECLRRAIKHGDVRWEADILASFHRLSRTPLYPSDDNRLPDPVWAAEHQLFHSALTAACDNEVWLNLRQQLFVQSERYRSLTGPYGETNRDVGAEHEAIMKATLARDTDKAVTLLGDHLRVTTDILLNSRELFEESMISKAANSATPKRPAVLKPSTRKSPKKARIRQL